MLLSPKHISLYSWFLASGSNICCVLAYKSVGGGKRQNAINNRANRAYFTYKAPTMLVHQTA